MSSSSRLRLLRPLLGAGPRFADDILERSGGELEEVRTMKSEGQRQIVPHVVSNSATIVDGRELRVWSE